MCFDVIAWFLLEVFGERHRRIRSERERIELFENGGVIVIAFFWVRSSSKKFIYFFIAREQ